MRLLHELESNYAKFGGKVGAGVNYMWIKEIYKDGVTEREL